MEKKLERLDALDLTEAQKRDERKPDGKEGRNAAQVEVLECLGVGRFNITFWVFLP